MSKKRLNTDYAEIALKLAPIDGLTQQSVESSIFCKRITTVTYELHDKSTYERYYEILKGQAQDIEKRMEELQKEIDNFDKCSESECQNYGDCQCMDTMENGMIGYRRTLEQVQKHIEIVWKLLVEKF